MNDARDFASETSPELEQFLDWMRATLTRVPKTETGTAPLVKIFVEVEREHGEPQFVDVYEFKLGDNVHQLCEEIFTRCHVDGARSAGARYPIRVEGVPARWIVSVEGEKSVQNAQMVARSDYTIGRQGGPVPYAGGHDGMGGGMGGHRSFRVGGPLGGGYEPQNPIGQFVTAMVNDKAVQLNHNERVLELAMTAHNTIAQVSKRIIEDQQAQLQAYDKNRLSQYETFENLLSKKHERDLLIKRQENSEARKDKVLEMVEPFATATLGRMLGAPGVPPQAAPVMTMFSTLAKNMTPERLNALMTTDIFTAEEKMTFLEVMKLAQQVQEEQDKAAAAGASPDAVPASVNAVGR